MSNQFKHTIDHSDGPRSALPAHPPKQRRKKAFSTGFFGKALLSDSRAASTLPFITFLAVLAMFYIGNHHAIENTIRQIDRLNREVEEMGWEYKTLKAELMLKSTRTQVSKKAEHLGLIESLYPPKKIKATLP